MSLKGVRECFAFFSRARAKKEKGICGYGSGLGGRSVKNDLGCEADNPDCFVTQGNGRGAI
tara:strand:- start:93543 stop:93725 length:183 start_codon:yes stop_codon:yes gene_type:complete